MNLHLLVSLKKTLCSLLIWIPVVCYLSFILFPATFPRHCYFKTLFSLIHSYYTSLGCVCIVVTEMLTPSTSSVGCAVHAAAVTQAPDTIVAQEPGTVTELPTPSTSSVGCAVHAATVTQAPDTVTRAPVIVEWNEAGVILPVPETPNVAVELIICHNLTQANDEVAIASSHGTMSATDNEAILEVTEANGIQSMNPPAITVVESLSPRPKIQKARPRTHKPQPAAVITSSPYKAQLQLKQQSACKNRKSNKTSKAAIQSKVPDQSQRKRKKCTKNPAKKPRQGDQQQNQDDTPCCICSKKYCAEPYLDFLQCAKCSSWYCEPCGPVDTNICYNCLP